MKPLLRLGAVLLLLTLPGCVRTINWALDRSQCGLKCPANSTCGSDPGGGGVFYGGAACVCKYPTFDADGRKVWDPYGPIPCAPKPSPSPKAPR